MWCAMCTFWRLSRSVQEICFHSRVVYTSRSGFKLCFLTAVTVLFFFLVDFSGYSREISTASVDIPEAVSEILEMLTPPSVRQCKKLVRVGGQPVCSCHSCTVDGEKIMCMDSGIAPSAACRILSFGIGFDLSFDMAMSRLGCRVVAFDPTNWNLTEQVYRNFVYKMEVHKSDHQNRYAYNPLVHKALKKSPPVHALGLGIDTKDALIKMQLSFDDGNHFSYNTSSTLRYQTILSVFDIPEGTVEILKVDIEGAEWRVLPQMLESPALFKGIRQILLEVHLDFLLSEDAAYVLLSVERAKKILRKLFDLGFVLVRTTSNTSGQKFVEFQEGKKTDLYKEVLLVRRI